MQQYIYVIVVFIIASVVTVSVSVSVSVNIDGMKTENNVKYVDTRVDISLFHIFFFSTI